MIQRTVVGSLAIALLLAACGGGVTEDTSDPDASTETSQDDPSASGEETLAGFFGWGSEDPEAAEAEYREQEARIQEIIRVCMAEQGFEYRPMLPPEDAFQVYGAEDEEERIAKEGFGITTWYGREDQFDHGMEWEDPNQEIVEAMSESERQAYYEALYGTEEEQMEGSYTEVDPETGEEYTVYEGNGAGCQGRAYDEVYGEQEALNDLWEEINPQMEAMYERIQADARIVELDAQWVACMAEAGFEFENRQNMYDTVFDDFQMRLDAILGPHGGYGDPFAGWTEEEINAFFEEKTEDEVNAFFEAAQEESFANVDQEALAALQQEEIEVAVADYECGKNHIETYEEVARDYESEFIAANREVLEMIRDAQGG